MASALDTARSLSDPVNTLGGKWMLDRDVMAAGVAAGYPNGFAFYVVGRGGVLGDVDADVVASAFGFFAPGAIRALWEAGIGVEGARAAADRYAAECAAWGRRTLGEFEDSERLADLLARIVDAAEPAGLPLFAGWRAQALPADPVGRAYQLLHVLREMRGSMHVVAAVAAGLSPLESILAKADAQESNASMFGWSAPFPDVSHLVQRRAEVEDVTDRLVATTIGAALSDTECDTLIGLVDAARDRVTD